MLSPYDYELLSLFRSGPQAPQSDQDRWEFNRLQREGYILPKQTEYSEEPGDIGCYAVTWDLTPKGKAFLAEADEVRNQQAQDEKHKRTQDKLGIANVLISLFSFLAGLLVEYKTGLIDLFLSLLQ